MLKSDLKYRNADYSSSYSEESAESDNVQDRLDHHTKINIKRQLIDLGYTDDIPEEVLEEFLLSMKEDTHQPLEDFSFPAQKSESKVMQRLKRLDLNPLQKNIKHYKEEAFNTSNSQHYSPQSIHSDQSFQNNSIDNENSFISEFTTEQRQRYVTKKPRKHDPVNRINEMKRIWANDKFLKRAGDLNAKAARAEVQSKMSLGPSTVKLNLKNVKL